MGTAWVECWKCFDCKHRWIKGELYPSQCPKRSCRSRKWDVDAGSSPEAAPVEPVVVAAMPAAVEPEPVADLSTFPVADRLAVARAAMAKVSEPKGEILPPAVVLGPCPYTEADYETGNVHACPLRLGHKGKHVRGPKVGDIW